MDIPKSVRCARLLTWSAIALATAAAVVSVLSLPGLATRFKLTWGSDFYLLVPLPYLILIALALIFRRTGAAISFGSSLLFSGFGIYAIHATPDAMGVGFVPIILLIGCGVVFILQVTRWLIARPQVHRG